MLSEIIFRRQNLRCESCQMSGHISLPILDLKLRLKVGDYQILIFIQIYSFRRQKVSICFSHYLIFNTARKGVSVYLTSTIIRLFISQILTVLGSLGEKNLFLNPKQFEDKNDSDHKTSQIKSRNSIYFFI